MPRSIKRPKSTTQPTNRYLLFFVMAVIFLIVVLTPSLIHRPSGNVLTLNGAPIDTSRVSAGFVENDIRANLKLGSSVSEVEQFLADRKIEHSFSKESKVVYAIVRHLRGTTLIASQNLTFKLHFDDNLRLSSIETNLEYTGP